MRLSIAFAFATIFAGSAHADIHKYICKDKGQSFPVRIDDARNEMKLNGKSYKIKVQESCAKFGWHAVRQGEAFDFCTATQGVAGFENGGPNGDCQQKL